MECERSNPNNPKLFRLSWYRMILSYCFRLLGKVVDFIKKPTKTKILKEGETKKC